jgi:hypothetical protein
MKHPKYLLINNQQSSLHNTLPDISKLIDINNTTISRQFKHKHFIIIKDYTIYKLNWKNNPPPAIIRFD